MAASKLRDATIARALTDAALARAYAHYLRGEYREAAALTANGVADSKRVNTSDLVRARLVADASDDPFRLRLYAQLVSAIRDGKVTRIDMFSTQEGKLEGSLTDREIEAQYFKIARNSALSRGDHLRAIFFVTVCFAGLLEISLYGAPGRITGPSQLVISISFGIDF